VCIPVVSGVGDVWPDECHIFHGGGVLRFVLPDQSDVGCRRPELRRRSGNHTRGKMIEFFIIIIIFINLY